MTEMTDLDKSRLRFGPYEVDPNTLELRKSGSRVKLSGQPFEILIALLERPGQLVTRDELRKRIWSEDTFVDFSHGLNAAVNKLREALCDSADEPRYIETLPRRGYRFIAPIAEIASVPLAAVAARPVAAPQSTVSPSEPVWKVALTDDAEWQSTIPIKRHTLVQLSVLATAIVLLAFGVAGLWWHLSPSPSPEEAELRLKRAGEPWVHEAAERSLKHLAENPIITNSEISRPGSPVAQSAVSSHSQGPVQPMDPRSGSVDTSLLALALSGKRIEVSQQQSSPDGPGIFRLDLIHAKDGNPLARIVTGREAIGGPQPSPDGSKLVFMAGSTEASDIWVCKSDGSLPRRLTNTGRAGTPRWSPDGRWIVFDSDGRYGRSGIYVVSVDGGPERPIVEDDANNSVPSWSRDGKYIYFASNRGRGWEADQVWKVSASGGQPFQITRQGGFSPYESMDGQTLYYAKTRNQNPEIWQVPVTGGTESRVSLLHPTTWASWSLTDKGILLLSEYTRQASELQYFDFATHSVHSLATLAKASFWLACSAKGSSIWYSELTDNQARQVFTASMD